MSPSRACREALGTARGDERDEPFLRDHLLACSGCREEVRQVRLLATAARSSLLPEVDPLRADVVLAALRASCLPVSVRWSFALAASSAVVLATLALLPPASSRPRPALVQATPRPADTPLVLEFRSPSSDRLRYVVHGPHGERHGEIDLATEYFLETVPANAVVVDTF